jgi:hypothetical protein
MSNFAIVCPHCYNDAVHSFVLTPALNDSMGSSLLLCENCRKKFRIYFQGGKICSVTRS